ncbi:MAG: hypothetical protein L0G99_10375 [Propionibacteriales bacterium]|nr:hypothetical protein [Propionibacteriales bacterium]
MTGVLTGALMAGVGTAFGVRALVGQSEVAAPPPETTSSAPQTPSTPAKSAAPTESSASPTPSAKPSSPKPTTSKASRPVSTAQTSSPGGEDTTKPKPKAELQSLSQLTVIPGAVGPVRAGMSRDEAMATGYLSPKTTDQSCGVPSSRWQWKPDYQDSLDLTFPQDASKVLSIGIRGQYPRTRSGYGVGTTWKELKSVVDGKTRETGYTQTGAFVKEGDAWIGFLFDISPDQLTDDSQVMMMEVSVGQRPDLMRDGC